jgi:hypothetical protein
VNVQLFKYLIVIPPHVFASGMPRHGALVLKKHFVVKYSRLVTDKLDLGVFCVSIIQASKRLNI